MPPHKLSEALSRLARRMAADPPVESILGELVVRVVEVLPVTSAGVTLRTPGHEHPFVTGSDPVALRLEQLQADLGEGPHLEALHTGEVVAVPDLGRDPRFPAFAGSAQAAGLGSVFSFPLGPPEERLGTLDLFRDEPGPLEPDAVAAARTLVDVTAAFLLSAQARVELRAAYDRMRESALHDPLTGLPNRALLMQRLEHAVLRARRSGHGAALLFADLDRFKEVNDSYGHHVGDELLVAVAHRLGGLVRPGDTLARLAGDEFVILCEDLDDARRAEALASRIGDALATPFRIGGLTLAVTASVGIAFAGRGDEIPERVVHDADVAMYQAKRLGGARHQVIDLRAQGLADNRVGLAHDLFGAAVRGELRALYQPILGTGDGEIAAVETLLEWDHPRLGRLPARVVVPLAEKAGHIPAIGRWVLRQACDDRLRWGRGDLGVSVNVSAHELLSRDFAENVERVLGETGTAPGLLTLEISEDVLTIDGERTTVVLERLRRLGVSLALDDFGTGYSSLGCLRQLPVDLVKVDRTFVTELPGDEPSCAIVSAVVQLAHSLGMQVVAEGVETAAQHREVAALGCDYYQGFLVARPMTARDVASLLHRRPEP